MKQMTNKLLWDTSVSSNTKSMKKHLKRLTKLYNLLTTKSYSSAYSDVNDDQSYCG